MTRAYLTLPPRYLRAIRKPLLDIYSREYPDHLQMMWEITQKASVQYARVTGRKSPHLLFGEPLRICNLMGKVIHFAQYRDYDCFAMHRNTLPSHYADVCNYIWDAAEATEAWITHVPYRLLRGITEVTYG